MPPDSNQPTASIVIPTRARLDYLRVALASIAPQAASAGVETIVVDDAGASQEARALAERFGARYEPHPGPLGLNVARNTGVERSTGALIVFVDDDVEVREGWLEALLAAAREHPERDVFTGPIVPRLEGSPARGCGHEHPPITALDLGPTDTTTRFAWGANMAIRRAALERSGPFDVSLEHGGDEQELQERLGGEALYVGAAALHHRRNPKDTRLDRLCRAAYARGSAARRFDAWRGVAPSLARELATLAGCLGHVVRYRCPSGLTMLAHSAGRTREAAHDQTRHTSGTAPVDPALGTTMVRKGSPLDGTPSNNHTAPRSRAPDDFLSGESGTVGGLDAVRRAALDSAEDTLEIASGRRRRIDLAARREPPRRRVLALCVARPEHSTLLAGIRAELAGSRHEVELHIAAPEGRGKFENLNALLDAHPAREHDWLLVLDDDIALPHRFLDRFLLLTERFGCDLAQPAHRRASHAAWRVTRRQPRSLVRETRFVEIGPVTALARSTFSTLLPFPDLRMGWGLDLHWAALAREHGWRCGTIDATPIGHRVAPAASAYSREQALAEARSFLAHRPYLSATEAQQTLVTHRRL